MIRYALLALMVLGAPAAFAQTTATLPVTCNASGSVCTQATPVTNPDGTAIGTAPAPTGAASNQVQGTSASSMPAVGNPVGVGGVHRLSGPLLTTGQRGDLLLTAGGHALVSLSGNTGSGTPADGASNAYVGLSDGTSNSRYSLGVYPWVFNGTTWDRLRGDTSGQYVVSKGGAGLVTAQVSVGATATLVAAARTGRLRLVITQSAAGPCYYGPTAGVSATTGARLIAAGGSKIYQYAGALYGICPGGAQTTDVDEEF